VEDRAALAIGRIRSRLGDVAALIAAVEEESLVKALEKLTLIAPDMLKTYVLGNTLAVAVGKYPLLQVYVDEGRVKVWEDWRERIVMAIEGVVRGIAREVMAMLLDREDVLPSELRDELRRIAFSVEEVEMDELKLLLERMRELLHEVESSIKS